MKNILRAKKFGCILHENMGDYHNHYLKKDVLLLADVFEKFIDICLKFYRLNPWTSGLS